MFSRLANKISTFGDHHQILVALVITFSLICVSWGVEKILERYFIPDKPLYGYILAIVIGLLLLWITKHIILHSI